MINNTTLVKKFISYSDIIEQIKKNQYDCLLIKIGGERCPPCRALDRGPLDSLIKRFQTLTGKKILTISCDIDKDDLYELKEKIEKNQINPYIPPEGIPAFLFFKCNNNEIQYITGDVGFNMSNPLLWIENFALYLSNALMKV